MGSRGRRTLNQRTVIPLHGAVRVAALANLAYFAVEFSGALAIGSVSLFADSIDFLEDASVNLLILLALGWSARARAGVGMALAVVLLAPSLATLWNAAQKLFVQIPPRPIPLSVTGAGALIVNLGCAMLLARYRDHQGSLTNAAFLSARNDAIANVAIITGAGVTAVTRSFWPDLLVGFGIAAMNADAAREVWAAAKREHLAARPSSRGAGTRHFVKIVQAPFRPFARYVCRAGAEASNE